MRVDPDHDPAGTVNGTDDEAAAELESLRAALTDAEGRALESRDALLRAVAETDNVRKRAQRDVEAASRFGVERFAADLLEVADSLDLGIAVGGAADSRRLIEGMEATRRLLAKAFERAGVAVVDPQGQPFNPELHEAVMTQESAEVPPGNVLAVVQKGYTLNGRLIRPARVVVSRAPTQTT